jgi:pimeloyl-ACP methyl ester carboxylesterase
VNQLFVPHDGLRHAVLDWGGDATPLVLLHPNGFCAGAFVPLAERLAATGRYRPVAVDLRGHGATGKPPAQDDYRYALMARDVIAVLDHLGIGEAVLLGNSLGGGVAILVDAFAPGRVRHLLLCEAICSAPEYDRAGRPEGLAAITLKRRAVWPSRQAMLQSWRDRPPFSDLAPETLLAYLEWGTVDREDGQVELACPPQIEAWIYLDKDSPAEAYVHLATHTASVTVMAGTTTPLPHPIFHHQAEQAGVDLTWIEGGHFFLQEDTDRAVALIDKHTPA